MTNTASGLARFRKSDANMLDAAAWAAEIFGAGEIRLTPWRALLLPIFQTRKPMP